MYPNIPIQEVYMFFDELQLIPKWEYFVLRIYKTYCKNIYVCGSNATMLSTELSSALRGYPLEYETYPLSFNEYCRFKGIKVNTYLEQDKAKLRNAFVEYNQSSAFPEVVLTDIQSDKLKLLHGYFDTMLLKDLAEHYKISNTEVVRYFVKRIMANLTKPTSINSIYNDIRSQGLKVTKNDLYQWANYICDIFMFLRIPKYERSLVKEHNSLYKYYFIDNGMRNAVLLPQSNDMGKYLENTVFMQLNRKKESDEKITYYLGNGECDFVVQRDEAVVSLYQVTWNMSDPDTRKREIDGLLEASKQTGCDHLYVITKEEEEDLIAENKQIKIIPAWKWLLQA